MQIRSPPAPRGGKTPPNAGRNRARSRACAPAARATREIIGPEPRSGPICFWTIVYAPACLRLYFKLASFTRRSDFQSLLPPTPRRGNTTQPNASALGAGNVDGSAGGTTPSNQSQRVMLYFSAYTKPSHFFTWASTPGRSTS